MDKENNVVYVKTKNGIFKCYKSEQMHKPIYYPVESKTNGYIDYDEVISILTIDDLYEQVKKQKEVIENLTTFTAYGDKKQIKNTAQYKLEKAQNKIDKAIEYIEKCLKQTPKEIHQLKDNWNKLKGYIRETKLKEFEKSYGKRYGKTFTQAEVIVCNMITNKMQELEQGSGSDE